MVLETDFLQESRFLFYDLLNDWNLSVDIHFWFLYKRGANPGCLSSGTWP